MSPIRKEIKIEVNSDGSDIELKEDDDYDISQYVKYNDDTGSSKSNEDFKGINLNDSA